MSADEFQARRIESLDDVTRVLESRKASFRELMDCATIARSEGAWQLRHRAAERAFETVLDGAVTEFSNLVEAATIILDNFLKAAATLDDLPDQIDAARNWIAAHQRRLEAGRAVEEVASHGQRLAEIQVLLSDDEPAARIRLCSRLRKVDRPDLGVESVRHIAEADRSNVAALTTLGAAYCDMGHLADAEKALRGALKCAPRSSRVLIALSRAVEHAGNLTESADLAKTAFEVDENRFTAHRLLAIAARLDDRESFDRAVAEVERAAEVGGDSAPDIYLLLLAAEALADQQRLSDVAVVMERITAARVPLVGAAARRYQRLRRSMVSMNAPKLFDDPPLE